MKKCVMLFLVLITILTSIVLINFQGVCDEEVNTRNLSEFKSQLPDFKDWNRKIKDEKISDKRNSKISSCNSCIQLQTLLEMQKNFYEKIDKLSNRLDDNRLKISKQVSDQVNHSVKDLNFEINSLSQDLEKIIIEVNNIIDGQGYIYQSLDKKATTGNVWIISIFVNTVFISIGLLLINKKSNIKSN